ncbi:MAG: ABC transporter ATP-binding protein, partial [Desulfuromusa sp.]|nr:ABC transporter ATP-binding protein [Desulfuromusa sp.]
KSYIGNYEDFLRAKDSMGDSSHSSKRVEQNAERGSEPGLSGDKKSRKQAHSARKEQQRRDQKQQKDLAQVENQIEVQEENLGKLEQQMADPDTYQDQEHWRQVSADHGSLKEELDNLYLQWEELQD